MFDDIGTFAGAVSDEEAWTLLEIFGEAVFVDDGRGCFGDLFAGFEHGGVDFHAAGVDHWDDVAGGSLDFARDDREVARDDREAARDDFAGLSDEGVEGADGNQRLAGAEA